MYPVDEKWGNTEVVEFPDHLVVLIGVESRSEVDKEESGEANG